MTKKLAKPIKNLSLEYFKTISTMLSSAFGLVAALAWNDVVKGIIEHYISPGSTVVSQLIYAVVVTTFVVIITVEMGKIAQRYSDEEDNKKE